MFKKKFKIRIRRRFSYYHLDWAYYRIFPDWKGVKIFRRHSEILGHYCGTLKDVKVLAESLDSYEKLKKWNDTQIALYEDAKNCIEDGELPDHIVKGY